MRKDEQRIFETMIAAVQGEDAGAASRATMNVVANLIVSVSPSPEQAEMGAEYAAGEIKTMVRGIWKELRGAPRPGLPTALSSSARLAPTEREKSERTRPRARPASSRSDPNKKSPGDDRRIINPTVAS